MEFSPVGSSLEITWENARKDEKEKVIGSLSYRKAAHYSTCSPFRDRVTFGVFRRQGLINMCIGQQIMRTREGLGLVKLAVKSSKPRSKGSLVEGLR